jgi:hypothetical protein
VTYEVFPPLPPRMPHGPSAAKVTVAAHSITNKPHMEDRDVMSAAAAALPASQHALAR